MSSVSNVTIAQALADFVAERQGIWAIKTYHNYRHTFKCFQEFIDPWKPIADMTRKDIIQFLNSPNIQRMAPRTQKKLIALLRVFFEWCVDIHEPRLLEHNPARNVRVAGIQEREKPDFTPEQVLEIVDAHPQPFQDMVYIYVKTALRPGELLEPKEHDGLWQPPRFNRESLRLHIPQSKTDVCRTVPIDGNHGGRLVETLLRHCNESMQIVFQGFNGDDLRVEFRNVKKRLRLPMWLHLHDLRKVGGQEHYDAGGDPLATMNFLGHKRLQTTMTYIRAKEATVRQAVEAMRY
uniref:Putative integrase n=1 Tax=viral metagenome TaxID=1070528 RepID=A0A6M3KZ92_9ZZZZ